MVRRCTVLIAARDLIEPLRQRLDGGGEVLTFADSEPLRALETITEKKPDLVALERLFAASPRGAALINRIKADPLLSGAEIVVVSHENNSSRTVHKRAAPVVKAPSDQRGTRRAPRVRIRPGVEIVIDGNPAELVDLSTVGAQVLSAMWLRPNTRVRVNCSEGNESMRVNGLVAWARFEIPGGTGEPRYRCGLEFTDADAEQVERFCARWKAEAVVEPPAAVDSPSQESAAAESAAEESAPASEEPSAAPQEASPKETAPQG